VNLWILRHGEAQNQAHNDAARELTPRGRLEVQRSAVHLGDQPLDAILVSPYVRAQQTAAVINAAVGPKPLFTVPWLTPESDPAEVLRQLDSLHYRDLLLVSHQPLVGVLIGLLQHGHMRQPESMGTASLAQLEGDFALAGLMSLRQLRHA